MRRTEEPQTLPDQRKTDPIVRIFVRGGVVQAVETTRTALSYRLIDLDNEGEDVQGNQTDRTDVETNASPSERTARPTGPDPLEKPSEVARPRDSTLCGLPALTPEAGHMLWELGHGWGVSVPVALNTVVRRTYAEEARREEARVRGSHTVELDSGLYDRLFGRCMETGIPPSTLLRAIVEGYLRDCEVTGQEEKA